MTSLFALIRLAAANVCGGLLLALAISVPTAAAPAAPQDGVRSFYATLLVMMKDGPSLGENGRYARLAPVVVQLFDIPLMARLAVGTPWLTLSASDQQRVVDAFGHYISATYADRFDSYSGQQLEVVRAEPRGAEVIVETRIVKSQGDTTTLNYLMRSNAGAWQIADVYVDDTISQVATQRSEFFSILRREGVDGLIATLNRKVDLLTRKTAGPS